MAAEGIFNLFKVSRKLFLVSTPLPVSAANPVSHCRDGEGKSVVEHKSRPRV